MRILYTLLLITFNVHAKQPCPTPESTLYSEIPIAESTSLPEIVIYDYCNDVSVEGDATYCVAGSICSGDGETPFGSSCPRAGDMAVTDCHRALSSWVEYSDQCVAPIDAECRKTKTGAWGCVFGQAGDAVVKVTTFAGTTTGASTGAVGALVAIIAIVVVGAAVIGVIVSRTVTKRRQKLQATALANEMNATTPQYFEPLPTPV